MNGVDGLPAGNQHGDLTDVTYSDGTAGYVQTHDRRGRLATTVRNGITTTHGWNDADLPLGEAHVGGSLNTLAVERAYFAATDTHALKLQALTVRKGGVAQRTATHAYDTAGRLSSVTADTGASAAYGYLPDSPLWQTLTSMQGAMPRLTTTRGFDRLNRLQTISSSSSSSLPVGVGYLYNDTNQRVRATEADGSHWVYEYDALGQVKGGRKHWSDGTPVAGQQFTYAHDDIGNRTATGAGGNEAGTGLRASAYTRNRLNQYTARTVPAAVDVLGVAASGSAVTVNSQSAYRRGEYFWKELSVANGGAPVATSVTVSAGGTPTTGKLVTPPANQSFIHDLDGNLTDDGVWTYTWDAENRLVGMQHKTTLADTLARRRLVFEYDARGRRIRKQVFPWGSSDYSATATSDQRFVYDGWNVVGVFDSSFQLLSSYIWGLDLSGTPQGAGGVGGLLAGLTGTTAQFAAYDGNGNVRALADGATGAWSAQYEYGPFGELIRATGPQARANPFRFSTKWHDDDTDLLYYGYRYYQPGTGRWLSRDPMEEEGGLNLYGFANNNAPNYYDRDGRFIGIFIGIGVDLTVQITANVATGRDWYDINVSSVVISGAVGLVAPGIGQVVKGVKNAGRLSTAIAKTKSKIPLRKNPSRIDRLNRRMQQQVKAHNQQVNTVARDVSIAAAWQASKFAAKKLADEIENEVKNMDGCPNDGYGLGASDSLEERVAVDPFSWNPFKYVDVSYYEHNGVPSEITIER